MAAFLPPAPRKLVSSYFTWLWVKAIACWVIAAAIVIGAGFWQGSEALQIMADNAAWENGDKEVGAAVDGEVVTRKFIQHSYKLKVDFEQEDGVERHEKIEFDTIFGSVDDNVEPLVHYSSADPKKFALNWAASSSKSRWASVLFFLAIAWGLGGGALGAAGFSLSKKARTEAYLAEHGQEVLGKILSVEEFLVNNKPSGAHVYTFDVGGQQLTARQEKGKKLMVVNSDAEVVALMDPRFPGEVLVVQADSSPVRLV